MQATTGAFAGYTTFDSALAFKLPEGTSHEEAASFQGSMITKLQYGRFPTTPSVKSFTCASISHSHPPPLPSSLSSQKTRRSSSGAAPPPPGTTPSNWRTYPASVSSSPHLPTPMRV
ncbi:hypothetical protein BDV98DRAFT_566935 [Pterulicium gracile]|uniref:Uncharacterized protein n=1 Tax=Pterulicium gracile TaxID=1884261 RepID=A0A5C3QM41_9AGAR|nr:hypothetical protein BDV98DRAFT_566935 [Pterula gracilis]